MKRLSLARKFSLKIAVHLLSFLLLQVPLSSNASAPEFCNTIFQSQGIKVPVDLVSVFHLVEKGKAIQGAKGFKEGKLEKHFQKHQAKFGVNNSAQYEKQAMDFLTSTREEDWVLTGPRTGAIFKFNRETNEFAVVSSQGILETYFIPDPAVHGYSSNLEYFLRQYEKY